MKVGVKKLGQIFDIATNMPNNENISFARSPQALVLEDRVRVYFSIVKDPSNVTKPMSDVMFADYSLDMTKILKVSKDPVCSLGELGAFDEHGLFPFSVTSVNQRILAYTTGWSRRVSVPVETGIGLMESFDGGYTFNRLGKGPILSSSLFEPYLVCDAFVRYYDSQFHMWYIFGTKWKIHKLTEQPERTYKIGYATSKDGVTWIKNEGVQIIPDIMGEDESQALPTVIKASDHFHMFFCYRESVDFRNGGPQSYQLGHAWSKDLRHWERTSQNLFWDQEVSSWDSEMQCYPNVFFSNNKFFLLYNGNSFGKYGFGLAELDLF